MAVLVATLGVLAWLRGELRAKLDETRQAALALFSHDVLGTPDDLHFRYGDIQRAARLALAQPLVSNLAVFKRLELPGAKARFHLVYPFAVPGDRGVLREGALGQTDEAWEEWDIATPDGRKAGRLTLRLERGPLLLVDVALAALGALLTGSALMLAGRLRRQEVKLHRTTVELEARLRQLIVLERLAMTGRLTAGLLHDLRKPLLAVRARAEEALDTNADDDAWRDAMEQTRVFQGMLRASGIERFARSGALTPAPEGERPATEAAREPCEVEEILRRALALVEHERKDTEVRVDGPPPETPPLIVEADPYELIQTFSNLFLNAYQAMRGRGRLTVRYAPSSDWKQAAIDIADNGPGIPPAERGVIFEPFRTSREAEGGSGLGLYIVRQIVMGLGGSIEVGTAPGGGALFTVLLPLGHGSSEPETDRETKQ